MLDWLAAGKTIAELRRMVHETPRLQKGVIRPPTVDDTGGPGGADDPWRNTLSASAFLAEPPKR